MANPIADGGLAEHLEPVLYVLLFLITFLLGIVGWFIKRTVGKIESNVEDLWELVRKSETRIGIIEARCEDNRERVHK